MRRTVVALAVLAVAVGCGSDENEDLGSAPALSNLLYAPNTAQQGQGDGVVEARGRVDFVDPDGDLAFVRLSTQQCGQGPMQHDDRQTPEVVQGVTSGRLSLQAWIDTDCPPDTYVAELQCFDEKGNGSNVLYAPFTITANETKTP